MSRKLENKWLYPIMFAWGVIPLIVRMKSYNARYSGYEWFADASDGQVDFFLIYKSYLVMAVAVLMIAILAFQILSNKKKPIKMEPAFYCLLAYAALALGSFMFSDYKYHVIHGAYELFEPIGVVLGYLVICYYTYYQINREEQVYVLIKWSCIGFAVLGIIGISQYFCADVFRTDLGKRIITPSYAWGGLDSISFTFPPGRVYATLYNPDWVGFYTNMILPILLVMIYWAKKIWAKAIYAILAVSMVICLAGSDGLGGIIGLLGAIAVTVLILLCRSKKGIAAAGGLVVVGIVVVALFLTNTSAGQNVALAFTGTNKGYENFGVKAIETNDEEVVFHLTDREMHISYYVEDEDSASIICTDGNGNEIETTLNPENGSEWIVNDPSYLNCKITPVYIDEEVAITVNIDGLDWHFSNQTTDGTYYYYNSVGKYVKMPEIKDAGIFNNDGFTNRGVIWNHTIPLLKHYIIFGSGANTYAQVYPQNDYIYKAYMNMKNMYDVKAHNWYLQQWVEEGLLALLSFLAFYMIYLIQCIKLYRTNHFKDPLACMGIALFIGISAYMISAIVNDSNVCTAPVFWVAIGLGYAVNRLVKEKQQQDEALS